MGWSCHQQPFRYDASEFHIVYIAQDGVVARCPARTVHAVKVGIDLDIALECYRSRGSPPKEGTVKAILENALSAAVF